jgi:BirA family transcriptional regulator, biotin operon repressor / biotin---[acetyl-CoA-carboxylase] ligase
MSRVLWYERLESTMTEAARLVREGAPSGTVVVAREQTAGQGRHGRQWISKPGEGLYATFLYRLKMDSAGIPCLTLAMGLAAAEALTNLTRASFDIRWPNDILWREKKCCGILARLEESAVTGGIGINLTQREFPEGLRTPAVSLWQICQRDFTAEEALAPLIVAMDEYIRVLEEEGREAIVRLFGQASSYVSGRRVQVDLDGRTIKGITAGLDEFGFGRVETVLAGGVRPWE